MSSIKQATQFVSPLHQEYLPIYLFMETWICHKSVCGNQTDISDIITHELQFWICYHKTVVPETPRQYCGTEI